MIVCSIVKTYDFFFIFRPTEMTLELEDTEESGEKLGAINATFTIEPKNVEDRQEVSNVHNWAT